MNTKLNAFNRTTHARYRPSVAKVYGTARGVPFQQVFKTVKAAERVAAQFNGFIVNLVH